MLPVRKDVIVVEDFYPAIIIMCILTYFMLSMSLTYQFDIIQQDVENIVFKYTQVAAKKGCLYQSVYDEMVSKIEKYGTFEISLKAERFNGATVTELEGDDIIDRNLRDEGYDLLTIAVMAKKKHPLSFLYSMNMFMQPTGNDYDIRLCGYASAALF